MATVRISPQAADGLFETIAAACRFQDAFFLGRPRDRSVDSKFARNAFRSTYRTTW